MVNVELLKSIPFFDPFTQEQLEVMGNIANLESFRTDQIILEENEINLNLFFMIEGAVDIFVDGDFVTTYKSSGEVIGEMSISNHAPSSATVVARVACSFVVLSFEELQRSIPKDMKDGLLKNFYKSCAEILAQKLKSTNQIMKEYYKAQKK